MYGNLCERMFSQLLMLNFYIYPVVTDTAYIINILNDGTSKLKLWVNFYQIYFNEVMHS